MVTNTPSALQRSPIQSALEWQSPRFYIQFETISDMMIDFSQDKALFKNDYVKKKMFKNKKNKNDYVTFKKFHPPLISALKSEYAPSKWTLHVQGKTDTMG